MVWFGYQVVRIGIQRIVEARLRYDMPILKPSNRREYLPLRQVDWRIVAGLILLNTLCLTSYRHLEYVAYGRHRPLLLTFLEEAVGGLAGLAVAPLIYLVAIRFPLVTPEWRRNILVHLAALCGISVVHTTVIAVLRMILFAPLGFGGESYGSMPVRYPMEFSHLFIYYWVTLAVIYWIHEIRFAREREVVEAKLRASLAETQLENLRLQLEPHFLFNTLNTISAVLYEDPRVADEMIGRLSDLLRHLLKEDRSQLISLDRELEFLELYTGIMEARLEERLRITVDVEDEVQVALVPQLVLQPLVENAIRYGMDASFAIQVEIEARRAGNQMRLSVRDYGPGIGSEPAKWGIGLRNTANRLERLFGQEQSLRVLNAEGGGLRAELCFPLRFERTEAPRSAPMAERVIG